MASLTDSYNSGNANRLSTISSANTMSEESLDYQPDPFDDQPPLDIKAKRGSFTKIKNKACILNDYRIMLQSTGHGKLTIMQFVVVVPL